MTQQFYSFWYIALKKKKKKKKLFRKDNMHANIHGIIYNCQDIEAI